jgi:hypothetical protein
MPRFRIPPLLLLAWVSLCGEGRGADAVPPPEGRVEASGETVVLPPLQVHNANPFVRIWAWSDARVRDIFDFILPETQERWTWKLSVQPHLSDLVRRDQVRLPTELTYGINRRAEGEIGFDPYFCNVFRDGTSNGVANFRTSFKYRWAPFFDGEVRSATGFQIVHPFASAPYDFNEGVNRYSVYSTFARVIPGHPDLEGFLNVSYDLITPAAAVGHIDDDEPQDDFGKVGTGVIYRHRRFTWGLAVAYARTVDGESTSFTTLTPSVIYDVPPRYAFRSPGQWQIGASVDAKRYGDETGFDFKVRVRWQVDFKRMVRDWRDARNRARDQASNR